MRRLRGDSGQTATEYLGLLTVVALVIAGLLSAGLGHTLRAASSTAACTIAGTCTPPAEAPADTGGGLLDGVGQFVGGFAAQAWDMVEGLGETLVWGWRTLTSEEQRAENAALWDAIVADPLGALEAMWDGATESIRTDWTNGRPAAAAGRATAEIASIVVPGKLLAKLKAAREARAAARIERGLLEELARSGVRYTPSAIVRIGRTADGRIVFLETGTGSSGLRHIIAEHARDFANVGVSEAEIPDVVFDAVTRGRLAGKQRTRTIYEIEHNGRVLHIAVDVADNGYIVGANPRGRR